MSNSFSLSFDHCVAFFSFQCQLFGLVAEGKEPLTSLRENERVQLTIRTLFHDPSWISFSPFGHCGADEVRREQRVWMSQSQRVVAPLVKQLVYIGMEMDGWMVSFIRRWFVAGESYWWCLSIGYRAATTDVLNEYSFRPPVRVFRVRLRLDQCVYHAIEKPFFVFVSSTSTSASFALEIDQISQPVSRHLSFIKLWLEPSGRHLLFNGIQLEMMSSNVNRKILFSNLSYRSNEQTLIR